MFKRVLIAIDGLKTRDQVLKATHELFLFRELDITLLNVTAYTGIPPELITADEEGIPVEVSGKEEISQEDKLNLLEETKNDLEGLIKGKVNILMLSGDPHRLICETAKDGGYDLLIIGLKQLIQGSTVCNLMNMPCSIFLIK